MPYNQSFRGDDVYDDAIKNNDNKQKQKQKQRENDKKQYKCTRG